MEKRITFVGLDAHKDSISVAVLLPGQEKPVEWQCANEKASVRRMVRKVLKQAEDIVRCCYEAGPCGYALQRWIREAGAECVVVAPSLIPRKPGERIKTDCRDARKLAGLLRAGLLTEVHPPTPEDEAARDLCRAREDAHRTWSAVGIAWARCCSGVVASGREASGPGVKVIASGYAASASRLGQTRPCSTSTSWPSNRSSKDFRPWKSERKC